MSHLKVKTLPLAVSLAIPALCLLCGSAGAADGTAQTAGSDAASNTQTLGTVVVSARRVETRLEDVPQRVEVVTSKDIDKTFQNDLTDLLKKNASADVVQYPGALSGIGIRGFSPEYNGINRHSALLVDGRPVAADNLATVNMGSIERVEVMKGPGSALYGSGAMGGVVTMVSRQSKGAVRGQVDLSAGRFETGQAKLRVGGSVTQSVDFDYAGSHIRAGDFTLGNGEVRPNTGYTMDAHSLRGGFDINTDWRLIAKWTEWRGRDVGSPGDLAYGTQAQQRKQMANSDRDVRLLGRAGDHALSATVFSGTQTTENTTLTSMTASYRAQLPAVNSASELGFFGWQLQDAWEWSPNQVLLLGVDTQDVKAVSRSYNLGAVGTPRKDPGTADNQRYSQGLFAENSWSFNRGATTAYVGVRRDVIAVETLDTPYKVGFTPSRVDFVATNPSAGFKHTFTPLWSLHATVGKAFIAPNALFVTGNYQTPRTLAGKTVYDYTVGNAAIRPESSVSKDLGVQWGNALAGLDVTVFDTEVSDRIVALKTTDTSGGANNGGVTSTYVNGDRASIQGLEWQAHLGFAKHYRFSVGGTRYFQNWTLVNGVQVDANIVPGVAVKAALDADFGPWSGRLSLRHRGRMKDQDWVYGGGKQIEIDDFTVLDLNLRYRIDSAQSVALAIENLTDRFYTEKFGYNMSGRNLRVNCRYDF